VRHTAARAGTGIVASMRVETFQSGKGTGPQRVAKAKAVIANARRAGHHFERSSLPHPRTQAQLAYFEPRNVAWREKQVHRDRLVEFDYKNRNAVAYHANGYQTAGAAGRQTRQSASAAANRAGTFVLTAAAEHVFAGAPAVAERMERGAAQLVGAPASAERMAHARSARPWGGSDKARRKRRRRFPQGRSPGAPRARTWQRS
jgi:hypothetical protein